MFFLITYYFYYDRIENMKKLILVDDHAMLRTGITAWFKANSDWEISLQCDSFEKLKEEFQNFTITQNDTVIAVVDLSYKQDDKKQEIEMGWEIVSWLRERNIPSIIFSSHDTGSSIEKAMSPEIGAKGFVSKCADEKILLDAINTVASGKTFIQPDLFSGFLEIKSILSALTPKEREITNLVIQNYDNDEIAEKLGIKLRTVENYLSKIYDKTGTYSKKMLLDRIL